MTNTDEPPRSPEPNLPDNSSSQAPPRTPASQPVCASYSELLARAEDLAGSGQRRVLAIVGPPGAGKSTLAQRLATDLGAAAVRVPMDGFHLSNAVLEQLGRRNRKGAADTFDVDGYLALLQRLGEPGTVYAPDFDRRLEEPVAGAITIAEDQLIITEGNYLLLDEPPWQEVAEAVDEAWFITLPAAERQQRLVTRHMLYGMGEDAALRWTMGTDEANAQLVAPSHARADLVVDLSGGGEGDWPAGMPAPLTSEAAETWEHHAMSTTSGGRPGERSRVVVRQALPSDARRIYNIVEPYAHDRVLIAKDLITYFESIQEFLVADMREAGGTWQTVGCGALHVLWDDIAEVRTLAVAREHQRQGLGRHVLQMLLERARALGLKRLFCLSFEVEFFQQMGFEVIDSTPVDAEVYAEMLRSYDDGVAEFLDLARVKPNTLGNYRLLLEL